MSLTGEPDGTPMKVGVGITDVDNVVKHLC